MNRNKLYSLNRIFSRNILRRVLDKKHDEIYSLAVKEYSLKESEIDNLSLIKNIYNDLDKNYRNEYFYKNTLLNKLLLGIHNVNTTTALTEIPVGEAKPDFVLINGKAVVYEIKTELDNLDRLKTQINEYYKAYDHVSIVTHEKNQVALLKKIDDIAKPVGVYILQKNKKLKTIRTPEKYSLDLDKKIIFRVLRKTEYENIILDYFGELPQTSQFKYYAACRELALKIPIDIFYEKYLKELKKRVAINKNYFDKVPYELKFLVYFMNFKKKDYIKLEKFLRG